LVHSIVAKRDGNGYAISYAVDPHHIQVVVCTMNEYAHRIYAYIHTSLNTLCIMRMYGPYAA